eukprot:218999-Rhodomonas_salina.2
MVWEWIVQRIEEENEDVVFGAGRRKEREGAVDAAIECGVTAAGAMAGRVHAAALGYQNGPC